MGKRILDLSEVENLRIASELSRGVVVDGIKTNTGSIENLIGVGSLVLTRQAFVGLWLWRMIEAKTYMTNFEQNQELVDDILQLNPAIPRSENSNTLSHAYWLMGKTIEKQTLDEMYDTFENTLRLLSE